jgi:hypothetical protein
MANGGTRSDFEIKLAPEVDKSLAAFTKEINERYDPKTVNRVLQFALVRGAASLVPLIRQDVPHQKYGTGRMQKAIRVKKSRYFTPGAVVGISLGKNRADKKGAYYAWMYTNGAKQHVEFGKRNGPLRFGPKIIYRVDHPGFKGHSFVEKSVQSHMDRALQSIAKITNKFLVDEAFSQRIFKSVNRWG